MNIFETMREITQTEMYKLHFPTLGVVTAIFPHSKASDKDNYECNVRLKNSDIELRKVPIATQCIGMVGIPRIGDLLIIVFVNGDMNYPVAIGRLYNDEDRPPLNDAEEMIYVPPYKVNPKVRRFYLEFPKGMIFKITDNAVDIKAGATKINVSRNGDVTIESKANVKVKADGNADFESTGDMNIKGANVTLQATGQQPGCVKAFGPTVQLFADKLMSLSSSNEDVSITAFEGTVSLFSKDKMKLKSENDVNINADKAANITAGTDIKIDAGASAAIKSKTTMDVEATAKLAIKGQIVTIN